MQEIYIDKIGRVITNKRRLEKELNIEITNKGKNVFINGSANNEFITLQVIEALKIGFSIERALTLKNQEILLQIIPIKNITKRKDLESIRARIIGTQGKTLRTLNNLTNCAISIEENKVGIIGYAEEIQEAIQSITSIIQGSKQSHVYSRLEKQNKRKRVLDKIPIINEFEKE